MHFWNRFFSSDSDKAEKKPLYLTVPEGDEAEPLLQRLREPKLCRRLERYFTRLWQVYPDGVIVRLNTGYKKLAERGAQLRRELGLEGKLDDFFALGGLTYQRSIGGRPSPALHEDSRRQLIEKLQEEFPNGVPTVAAVDECDHRLYLNLRAVARKQSCTMTEFLRRQGLMKSKEGVVCRGVQ